MERFDQLRGEEYINEWPRYSPQDLRRREATLIAAKLAVGAAMTAPVAGGVPQAEAHLVYGQEEMKRWPGRWRSWPIRTRNGRDSF